MGRVKRIWYLSPMRAAKVQASLHICAVLPEPPLLAHTSSESRGTFRQKARSLAPQNGWACSVKICYDRMLEDTNSLDRAQIIVQQTVLSGNYLIVCRYMLNIFCQPMADSDNKLHQFTLLTCYLNRKYRFSIKFNVVFSVFY